jgi:hypothetical protein
MALLDTLREKRSQILENAAKHGAFNVQVFTAYFCRVGSAHHSSKPCRAAFVGDAHPTNWNSYHSSKPCRAAFVGDATNWESFT